VDGRYESNKEGGILQKTDPHPKEDRGADAIPLILKLEISVNRKELQE
jgi:hypothetical protein